MERTDTDVDVFLDGVEGRHGDDLCAALDAIIRAELASLERVLWEGVMWGGTDQRIVGYGAISQPRPRGASVDWFLVGLAAQQRHLSLYVNAADGGAYLVKAWADRLGTVKVGSAAVTFTTFADLDEAAMRAMLRRARELTPAVRSRGCRSRSAAAMRAMSASRTSSMRCASTSTRSSRAGSPRPARSGRRSARRACRSKEARPMRAAWHARGDRGRAARPRAEGSRQARPWGDGRSRVGCRPP